MVTIEIKELTEIECLELALEYSISKKHKESLLKRIENYSSKVRENKKDTIKNKPNKIDQVGFF